MSETCFNLIEKFSLQIFTKHSFGFNDTLALKFYFNPILTVNGILHSIAIDFDGNENKFEFKHFGVIRLIEKNMFNNIVSMFKS